MIFTENQKVQIETLFISMFSFDNWEEEKHKRDEKGRFSKNDINEASNVDLIGPFGKIHKEFHHDAKGAVKKLISEKGGEAIGALYHPDIGDIDLIWGEEGNPENEYRGGYGLAKIVAKHPEVVGDLQGILSNLKVIEEKSGSNRVRLQSTDGKYRAAIRLTFEGESKKWLLTMFEKSNRVINKRTDTANFSVVGDTALYNDPNTDFIIELKLKKFQLNQRIKRLLI